MPASDALSFINATLPIISVWNCFKLVFLRWQRIVSMVSHWSMWDVNRSVHYSINVTPVAHYLYRPGNSINNRAKMESLDKILSLRVSSFWCADESVVVKISQTTYFSELNIVFRSELSGKASCDEVIRWGRRRCHHGFCWRQSY